MAKVSDLINEILDRRGYSSAEQRAVFLNPDYVQHGHDPFLMQDMPQAIARLQQAIEQQEQIAVYGDYDIDGIAATCLMVEGLQAAGAKVISYIPDRFEEGYGLNQKALEYLLEQGVNLVVTVDCGVASAKEIKWAKQQGLDVIVTDHHSPPEILPEAIPVINPKVPGDQYPFKDLAGVGVAFKVIQALQQKTGQPEAGQEKWLLDLVALGTTCDMVALVDENRMLTKYGLLVMQKTRRPGLRALANVAGIDIKQISTYHLGFMFGPRLNAAGRLEHAKHSLELMQATNQAVALELAEKLNQLNLQRRADQARIFTEANRQAEQHHQDPVLVLADAGWSHGIVGIVASNLVERWHKPALVLQILGATAKGSARSVGAFNLAAGLQATAAHLLRYGGHHFAAGLTLKTKNIEAFRQAICAHFESLGIDASEAEASEEPDIELPDFSVLDWPLWQQLQLLEPFGNGNPEPIFQIEGLKVVAVSRVGQDKKHLRLRLADAGGRTLGGIGFRQGEHHPNLKEGQRLTVDFQLSKNEYMGNSELQLVVADLR